MSEGNDGRAVRVLLRVLLILSQYNGVRRVVRLGVRVSTHAYRMRVAGARQAVQWQPSVGSKKGS